MLSWAYWEEIEHWLVHMCAHTPYSTFISILFIFYFLAKFWTFYYLYDC